PYSGGPYSMLSGPCAGQCVQAATFGDVDRLCRVSVVHRGSGLDLCDDQDGAFSGHDVQLSGVVSPVAVHHAHSGAFQVVHGPLFTAAARGPPVLRPSMHRRSPPSPRSVIGGALTRGCFSPVDNGGRASRV